MTKVVVTNVFGPLNRGDYELFRAALEMLHARGFDVEAVARDPDLCAATFDGVTFHEQLGKADRGALTIQRLLRVLRLAVAAITPWLPWAAVLLPARQRSAVRAIRSADAVIACPGGYLEDSRLSLYPQLVQLWVAAMSRPRLVLAPMSIGPVRGRFPRWLLKKILARADSVFVRETVSDEFCRELGIVPVISNDLAFLHERFRAPVQTVEATPEYFAVTAINWSFPTGDRESASRRYVASLIRTIDTIASHTGLPVKLLVQVENDLAAIEQVAAGVEAPAEIVRDINTPEKIQRFLQHSYCLVASRFHSAIFALAVSCPVVALAYLPKTRGMLTLYEMEDLCFGIDGFDPDELANTLTRWGDDRAGFYRRCTALRQHLDRVGNPFAECLDALAGNEREPGHAAVT